MLQSTLIFFFKFVTVTPVDGFLASYGRGDVPGIIKSGQKGNSGRRKIGREVYGLSRHEP